MTAPTKFILAQPRGENTKNAGKPDAEWLVRERIVTYILEKPSGFSKCVVFLSLPGPALRQNQQTVRLRL